MAAECGGQKARTGLEKYELEFMKSHKGYSPKEWEEHLATERYRSRTLSNNSGGGGDKGADDTYYIADIVNGKSFNASKDQVIKHIAGCSRAISSVAKPKHRQIWCQRYRATILVAPAAIC